jgi:tryptophan 7-halogenase
VYFSHPHTESTVSSAQKLIELIANLKIPYGYEQSLRISHQTLLANRFLLSISKPSLGNNPHGRLLDLCSNLAIPEEFLALSKQHLDLTRFVHFGFEENHRKYLYKVYLELDNSEDTHNRDRTLLHLSFKWNPLNKSEKVITKYYRYPALSVQDILEKVSQIYQDDAHSESLAISNCILEIAAKRSGDSGLIYLEVIEENNSRKSYDLNIYSAKLRVRDIQQILVRMFRYYAIPENLFLPLYTQIKDKLLGHIAGGIHRNGQDFFNIYYGMEGR